MYIPKHFDQSDVSAVHELIVRNPLGALVTARTGGLSANHIPFELVPESGRYGVLKGHVARANPVWREVSENAEVMVNFQGASSYISPA